MATDLVQLPTDPDKASGPDERDRLRAMLDAGSDLLMLVDDTGSPIYINGAVQEILGYRPDELLAANPLEFMHPDDIERMAERLGAMGTDAEQHGMALVRVRHREDHWRWLEILPTDRMDDPRIEAIVINARDVTDRIEAQQELAREKERFQLLVDSIPDMVARLDRHFRVQYLNPAARTFLDLMGGESLLVGTGPDAPESQRTATRKIVEAFEEARSSHFDARFDVGDDGIWLEISVVPEAGPDGQIDTVMTVARDITHRKATESALNRQVLQDPLTGLANRVGFEAALGEALEGDRRADELVAVLYVDIDNFKLVNDTRGHMEGDDFLRRTAERMRDAVRPEDTLARLGGDEFAVLPSGLETAADAERLAERIHGALSDLSFEYDDVTVGSVSIGIAVHDSSDGEAFSGEWLLVAADRAMYDAKRQGRGRTVISS